MSLATARNPSSSLLSFAACALLITGGCGGSGSSSIIVNPAGVASFPADATPGTTNTYIGTQSPGVWSLTLNDTTNTYSYLPVTYPNSPNTPVTGSFKSVNGFLSLGQANGVSLGYILEVPGRMAILRPGGTDAPLIVGVPQASCYQIPYRLRFPYIGTQSAPGGNAAGQVTSEILSYGSFVANTNASGSAWQYQNLQGTAPDGTNGFTGSCAVHNSQAVMSLSNVGLLNQFNGSLLLYNYQNYLSPATQTTGLTSTLEIGPSGMFIADQSDPANPGKGSGIAGIAEQSSALSASAIVAGTYLGFIFQASSGATPQFSGPVSFGQTPATGTTMIGGTYPNDDVKQTPNTDLSISLGSQSSAINGFYPSASVTTLDPAQNCLGDVDTHAGLPVTPGINAEGFATCTFPAVIVAGIADGNYVLFVSAFDYALGEGASGASMMQIYLYQQQ